MKMIEWLEPQLLRHLHKALRHLDADEDREEQVADIFSSMPLLDDCHRLRSPQMPQLFLNVLHQKLGTFSEEVNRHPCSSGRWIRQGQDAETVLVAQRAQSHLFPL